MSSYCVSIGERKYNVQVTDSHLVLDGEPVQFDLVSLNGNGLHLFRRGYQSMELYFNTQSNGIYEVSTAGRRVVARVDLAYRRRRSRKENVDAGVVVAPMPGLVVDVEVQSGDSVESGQVLVVQEAMKMQMQLRSPFAGRVMRVDVGVGDRVEKGAVLVHVELQGVVRDPGKDSDI
ncbi:MAG: hypothetical protein JXA33_05390 [Anaerolineae bacterium]|nr:hypothetical protein [Anaerolineae bacterium]